jgi:2-polyprenyl-6-methoxyphenol hydroxylase-like FAD-dependent oxidoreductase
MTGSDVLIVGAGPTGLALAIELARREVSFRIVEREPERHVQSRATDLQSRTLEVFYDLGVIDEVLALGVQRHKVSMWVGDKKVVEVGYEGIETPYCYSLGLEQQHTERVLEERLEQLGGRVERHIRCATLEQDAGGVDAVLLQPDGRWVETRFGYVVGCDGAHSAVRHAMGIGFEGRTFEESFFLADVKLRSHLPKDEQVLVTSDAGMLGVLTIPGEGWVRVFGDVAPGESPELDFASCSELISSRMGDVEIIELGWHSLFHIHSRQVARYRKRRVLLAGDAAHIHSPAGGHGMNTGIQDAYNLGWKLALVCQEHATPALLDSYHAERHPVAKALIAETDLETRFGMWRNSCGQEMVLSLMALATKLTPIRQRMLAAATEIAVGYRDSAIVAQHRGSVLHAHLTHDQAGEEPSIVDHQAFAGALQPGDRVPDVVIGDRRLYDLQCSTRHVLLLFDGKSATSEGYAHLDAIANAMKERFGVLIDTHVVVLAAERPAMLEWDAVVLDTDGALHDRFGAGAECLYLIRPDGYLGYRAQPIDGGALECYFAGLLGGD